MTDKKITLQPHKAFHFWWYLTGIVLIPFFGLGIYIIYKKFTELRNTIFEIRDQSIKVVTPDYSENMDITGIHSADVTNRWIDERFSIGTLLLKSDKRKLELFGVENPRKLADIILQAAEAERKRLEEIKIFKSKPETQQPDNLEKLDYLTGLWQQGLLSDEDFKKEKKHFEG